MGSKKEEGAKKKFNTTGFDCDQDLREPHNWFKSYSDFAELMDFAYWWSFSGGWSAINGATPSSFMRKGLVTQIYTVA